MRLPNSSSIAALAATAGCALLSITTPAAAGPVSAVTAPGAGKAAVELIGHRHRRYHRHDYYGGTTVDAPFAYVESRRRRVAVDAPFASVRTGRRGTWVRAPFVDLFVPR